MNTVLPGVQMQGEHMDEIWQIFGNRVRSVVPLFETEIQGPTMLSKLANSVFV